VKLRITGLEDVVLVPVVVVELVELLELVEELEDEELELPVLEVELEPVVPVFEVEDEPAFWVVLVLEVELLAAALVEPLVLEAPWPLAPLAPEPPAWPPVLPAAPFPVPVVDPVPPISPTRASTWQRTLALFALSIVPFSTTTISMSPESISTNRNGACGFRYKLAGLYPACQAQAAPPRSTRTAIILTTAQGFRRTLGISIGSISNLLASGNIARPVS
jgi:hypothetical protein